MSDHHTQLPVPPRKIPLRIRWYLQYGEFATGWDWIELAVVALLFLCLYFWGTRGFIDRHHAGWEPMEQKGTVESYVYRHKRGTPIGYQCHELQYTFKDQQGIQREGESYKNVPFTFQDDKSFQKGDTVPLEKYKYLKNIHRVAGTRAYPSDWRLPFFAVFLLVLLWLLSWFSWRSLWFLRNGKTTTARLAGSEIVLGSRQDSYEFSVDGNPYSTLRVILQPKNDPAPAEQIVFYSPKNPNQAKLLVDISPNLKIENGRLALRQSNRHVWGSIFIGLSGPLFFATLLLIVSAPYWPF